ncbi:MAG TPA: IS110 family transposase [Actinomycetota bacterium]|nr:IS110 family transposase [Actinomycetota bacterium]
MVLEATGGALAIARILERYAGRVVMANPMAVRAIASAKAKTDRLDARTLAKLLAAGFLPSVWLGDERTRLLRRLVSRHAQLIRQRTRAKNQIHAVLQRTLMGRPPASDLFGKRGRAWLDDQDLPADERETVQASLRHVEFLDGELRLVDRTIAEQILSWPEVRRIMTIPGMGATAAAGVMAAIGDVRRFPTPRHLVAYLGLDARVRQSGSAPARHGGISKRGSSEARHLLVEAARAAIRTPGPLRAFGERIRARRGANIATVPWLESSPCCAGICSPGRRTTPSLDPLSSGRRSGSSSWPPETPAGSATATRSASSPRRPSTAWSRRSEPRPRRRTGGS